MSRCVFKRQSVEEAIDQGVPLKDAMGGLYGPTIQDVGNVDDPDNPYETDWHNYCVSPLFSPKRRQRFSRAI